AVAFRGVRVALELQALDLLAALQADRVADRRLALRDRIARARLAPAGCSRRGSRDGDGGRALVGGRVRDTRGAEQERETDGTKAVVHVGSSGRQMARCLPLNGATVERRCPPARPLG